MKMENNFKRKVLNILFDNLQNPHPQVVSIDKISEELGLPLSDTRQLLLHMDAQGVIKSDMDGHYSLITPAGIHWIGGSRLAAIF